MDNTTIVVAMLAALWGSATIFFHVTSALNVMRDAVLTGRLRGDLIGLEHRRLLLDNDWRPLRLVITFLGLGLAAITALVAISVSGSPNCLVVLLSCGVASVYSLGVGLMWLIHGRVDMRVMEKVLAELTLASPQS